MTDAALRTHLLDLIAGRALTLADDVELEHVYRLRDDSEVAVAIRAALREDRDDAG